MFLAQVCIDVVNAVRHLKTFLQPSALDDESLILKTILWEGFSGGAIRPWSVHAQRGPKFVIVGYSQHDAAELNKRRALALPSVQEAIGEVIAVPLPLLTQGERYRFSVRLCPTIRITPSKDKSHAHGEIDAFLVAVQRGEENIERQSVYTHYLAERLKGANVETAKLTRFRLERMTRPHRGSSAPASGLAQRAVPDAVLEGTLSVSDPTLLVQTLMSGIGRQRAFGRGYVRLVPTRLTASTSPSS